MKNYNINNKIKISIILPNLRAGGAERVMSFVAQKLNNEIFDSTLVIIGKEKEAAYTIKNIKVIFFNKNRVKTGIIDLFLHIRSSNPDIVFSAVGHLNTVTSLMTYFFPNTKFVAREVNVLSVLSQFTNSKNSRFRLFTGKNRFNRFDKIVCQSEDMLNDLKRFHNIKQDKLVIINNPITPSFKLKTKTTLNKPIQLITVARLVRQKGHARLMEVLGKVDFPFHYTILGDGPEKENIFKRATELGFINSITHVSFSKDVAKYLENSDLYLQGSFVEGFPNAIIESLMVGTPVLAFDAPGGINEIILTEKNGYVAKNEAEYLNYLKKIVSFYPFVSSEVSETVSSRYSEQIIIEKYERLFTNLVS